MTNTRPHPHPETLRVTMWAGLREALRAGQTADFAFCIPQLMVISIY
jgi:hypothetical protein